MLASALRAAAAVLLASTFMTVTGHAQVPNTQPESPVAPPATIRHSPGGMDVPLGAGVMRMVDESTRQLLSGEISFGNMTYHGGPVQHTQKVFTIFWSPSGYSFPVGYQAAVNQFVQDLNNSTYYGIASQYYDSTNNIATAILYGATWLDTSNPFPRTALTSSDLLAEVNRAKTVNGWTSDANSYFQIYTPSGISNEHPQICGLHYPNNPAFGQVLFPQPGCYVPSPSPNGQAIDTAINTSAHEIIEALTDPLGNAWYYVDGGGEVADLCGFTFGNRVADGSNVTLNGHKYLIQEEWSNAASGCVLSLGDAVTYVSDSSGRFGTVNPTTGTSSMIGSSGVAFTDIALTSTGAMWGITFNNLYSIDAATGVATLVGPLNAGGGVMNALVANGAGLLAASYATTSLYSVNTVTGAATALTGDVGYASAGDLAFHAGALYGSVLNGGFSDLVRITLSGTSFTATNLGHVTSNNALFALAEGADGNLYGIDGTTVRRINTSNPPASVVVIADYSATGYAANRPILGPATGAASAGVTAAGGSVVSESIPSGHLDPNERVTVALCISNSGAIASGGVTGTLLAIGGVRLPSGAASYGAIAAGGNVCRNYAFTVETTCGTTLSAILQTTEVGGPIRYQTYRFQVGGPVSVLNESFDAVVAPALPAGWTTTTLSGTANLWMTNTISPDSAPNRAFTSDPSSVSDNVLASPMITLQGATPQLTFRHLYNVENGFDGGVLEIAIGAGSFQDIIAAGGSFAAGAYNGAVSAATGNPIGGRQAWTGNTSGYVTTSVNMPSAAAGQSVRLRFRMATDSSISGTGWAVDTFSVSAVQCSSLSTGVKQRRGQLTGQ